MVTGVLIEKLWTVSETAGQCTLLFLFSKFSTSLYLQTQTPGTLGYMLHQETGERKPSSRTIQSPRETSRRNWTSPHESPLHVGRRAHAIGPDASSAFCLELPRFLPGMGHGHLPLSEFQPQGPVWLRNPQGTAAL